MLSALFVVLVVRHYEGKLPTLDKVRKGYEPPQVTRVLARDGTRAREPVHRAAHGGAVRRHAQPRQTRVLGGGRRFFLPARGPQLPRHAARAMAVNLRSGRSRQGASTITQQVVKNVLLVPERSYERKIKETILARRLEQELTKDEILSLYLNQIYLGHGRYGVEEASRYYFGKRVRELDVAEAATLAGLVASPERYSPRRDAGRSMHDGTTCSQMLEKGFITQDVFADAEQRRCGSRRSATASRSSRPKSWST